MKKLVFSLLTCILLLSACLPSAGDATMSAPKTAETTMFTPHPSPPPTQTPTSTETQEPTQTVTPTPKAGEVGHVEPVDNYYGMGGGKIETVDVSEDKTAEIMARTDLVECRLGPFRTTPSSRTEGRGSFTSGDIFHPYIANKSLSLVTLTDGRQVDQVEMNLLCKVGDKIHTIHVLIRGAVGAGSSTGLPADLGDVYASSRLEVGKNISDVTFSFIPPGSKFTGQSYIDSYIDSAEETGQLSASMLDLYKAMFAGWGVEEKDHIAGSDVQHSFATNQLDFNSSTIHVSGIGQ